MYFVLNRINSLKEKIEERKDSPDYGLMKEMLALLEDVAGKQDLQTVKNDEIEEELEYLTSVIKDMQQVILDNFDLEGAVEEQHAHECDCGDEHCDHEHIDEFYTLQCPFCEELFFIENDEIDGEVECPFCQKKIVAAENIVKH